MSVGFAGKLDGRLTCASRSSAGQPLCLIGDSGTGKSHLLIGLGTAAAEHGYRVRYTTAAALVSYAQRTNMSATPWPMPTGNCAPPASTSGTSLSKTPVHDTKPQVNGKISKSNSR
jgi:hypothetical protein